MLETQVKSDVGEDRKRLNRQARGSGAAMVRRIGLLNHIGWGNLGDDATEAAVMQNINKRWPDAEISLFSMNPPDTRARHGVAAYPIRTEFWKRAERQDDNNVAAAGAPIKNALTIKNALRRFSLLFRLLRAVKTATISVPSGLFIEARFLGRSFLILRSLDLLIVSGGGQLLDSWGGPWKFPYTIFIWTLLARLSGIKCYVLNVGAGPLDDPLARWFVRNALRLADYVSFRDGKSRDLVRKVGFKGESHVFADCVCSLDTPSSPKPTLAAKKGRVVGLSPMAYCDPRVYWQKDRAAYERFVDNVASFGGWLHQKDYRLALFSTDIWFDSPTIEEVKSRIEAAIGGPNSEAVKQERIASIDDLIVRMKGMDFIVTCRFHGVVFAHLLNKPVLALSHHTKVATLMNDLGLAKYCVDIRKCDGNMLQETFLSMVADEDKIKSRMAETLAAFRLGLSSQFDQLFPSRNPNTINLLLRKDPAASIVPPVYKGETRP
jgi:polysaccharide pyruvyl transferase WcaK-like protein